MVIVYATTSIHREKWAVFDNEEMYSACADTLDILAKQSGMEITTSEVEKDIEDFVNDGEWVNVLADIRTRMIAKEAEEKEDASKFI